MVLPPKRTSLASVTCPSTNTPPSPATNSLFQHATNLDFGNQLASEMLVDWSCFYFSSFCRNACLIREASFSSRWCFFSMSLLDPRANQPHGHVRESEFATARSSHQQLVPGQPAQHQKGIRRWAAAEQKPVLANTLWFVFPLTRQKKKNSLRLQTVCFPWPLYTLPLHNFIFSSLPVLPQCMEMLTVPGLMLQNLFVSTLLLFDFFFFFFFFLIIHLFFHAVSQSPAIMHMLDKSGSCGKFDNYQRPEGFPVGTCRAPFYPYFTVFFWLTVNCVFKKLR